MVKNGTGTGYYNDFTLFSYIYFTYRNGYAKGRVRYKLEQWSSVRVRLRYDRERYGCWYQNIDLTFFSYIYFNHVSSTLQVRNGTVWYEYGYGTGTVRVRNGRVRFGYGTVRNGYGTFEYGTVLYGTGTLPYGYGTVW